MRDDEMRRATNKREERGSHLVSLLDFQSREQVYLGLQRERREMRREEARRGGGVVRPERWPPAQPAVGAETCEKAAGVAYVSHETQPQESQLSVEQL
jgi:hypothetical protein